ncbi:MAG: Uncharacterized protein G01um10147_862 [Microgenomates group bacterium Gr01-1014_7]|nr:MAG: Uncharacterized protein G01um10147_862 [Microgenomates group bacterium Gr01-1014_7]
MRFLSKNTQTLITSCISAILFVIAPNITQSQEVFAIYDPLSAPNNKYGIHIIQATPDESSPAASLVNSSGGDWGYITFLIESKDRNESKWQEFFNDLRRRHLIPIVRLATKPVNEYWEVPYEKEYEAWADFLDNLNWPVKNRYVVIYNEPNHAKEWGNFVDAKSYAKVLDQTITALKSKNRDFFVLNAGLDSAAPSKLPQYEDQFKFMELMNEEVPGIFNKLDGWVSHSYPNPGFVGSPDATGRGSVRGYIWELQQLRKFGVTKTLPVFITETGWKHAEGLKLDPSLPDAGTVASYYLQAFQSAWNNPQIVAVTPFLLSYLQSPFDHFSFKKPEGNEYYPVYQTLANLTKQAGKPIQDILAKLTKGEVYSSIVAGETYSISLTFKNTGQPIWNDSSIVSLRADTGAKELGIDPVEIARGMKIEPGQEYEFKINLRAPLSGIYKVSLNLFDGEKQFNSKPVEFTTEVKSPVILRVKTALTWKKSPAGNYYLTVKGPTGDSMQLVNINSEGGSNKIEARYLLPDYTFEFSLERKFYKPKSINLKVYAGENILDFGTLKPDILAILLNLPAFWKL